MRFDKNQAPKVLLDTNLIIKREDNREVEDYLGDLLRLFQMEQVRTVLHPSTLNELQNDKDSDRKRKTLSKVRTYNFLENPPIPGDSFVTGVYGAKNSHDVIDSHLLYCVCQDVVDFLITDDERYPGLIKALEKAFEKNKKKGFVTMEYETKVYAGKLLKS